MAVCAGPPRAGALLMSILGAIAPALGAQTAGQADSAVKAAKAAQTLPLITTRTLRFTTDEGTWLSVDVSPDGTTIVFDLLGDLYTLPIQGGRATRITSGPGFDAQPRYSPDGKQVLFVSDRNGSDNLWVANRDGTGARALTADRNQRFRSPAWMGPGHVVADKGNDLWLYGTSQKEGIRLTNLESPRGAAQTGVWYLGPAFGGDSRYIWLNRASPKSAPADGPGEGPSAAETEPLRNSPRVTDVYQIARLDRETGYVAIRTDEEEGAYRPVPSPDGRWLVYATRYDGRSALKLRDLRTGAEQWLRMDVQPDASRTWATLDVYPGSSFTPDSKALITSFGGKIWRVDVPSGKATPIPFTADVEQALGPLAKFDYPIADSAITVRQVRGARPSPDGTRLAFAALDRLWVADLPTAGPRGAGAGLPEVIRTARRLTSAELVEHDPVWSPDGRWIAYVTWSDRDGGHLYRVRSDGREAPERLTTTPAYYDKVAWSADGARLVAVRGSNLLRIRTLEDYGRLGREAELELVWLPAEGGEPRRIVDLPGGMSQQGYGEPHFGPEPDRIYLSTDGVLASMRFDGTDRREVLKVTGGPGWNGAPAQADEIRLAPDGLHALALIQQNVHLITMPPATGQTPTVSVVRPSFILSKRLSRFGADFIGWRSDSRGAFWSIGRSFFQHDLARMAPASDSARPAGGEAARRSDIEIVVPKDRPRGTIVLSGGRLVTMKGDEIIERGDLVVTDNRIAAIGPTGQVAVPVGARVIDIAGATVIPGYVDVHAHSWVAWGLHRDQVSQYLAQLAYGVTTQRDPQTTTTDVLSYADLVETGALIGPRLESTGPGLHTGDAINSLEDARDVLRRYADFYHTRTVKQYAVGDRDARQWFITAARELGLTPTAEGAGDIKKDLSLLLDGYGGLEHVLPVYPLFRDVVELLRFSETTYTPTLIVNYGGPRGLRYFLTRHDMHADPKLRYFTPHDELDKWKQGPFSRDDQYVFDELAAQLTKVVRRGGRVGLGAHGEVQGLGAHWELQLMASGGLTPHEVLRIGTLQGAAAIGLDRDIGSLEVGKLADLQVLDRNPLDRIENTTSIRYVMKNGRLYDAATLDELWPRTRPLPPQWWWTLEPPGEAPAKTSGRGREGRN